MSEFLVILVSIYSLLLFGMTAVWLRMPDYSGGQPLSGGEEDKGVLFSVVVPVRNEEKYILTLLRSLEKQSIGSGTFEVLIMDDQSSDATPALVEAFISESSLPVKLIRLHEREKNSSPKKRAITKAVSLAAGKYIITTDGDCEVPQDWLTSYAGAFSSSDTVFVSGPVTFFRQSKNSGWMRVLWNKLQTVEFASLAGTGACMMAAGIPGMCSGANMAYTKKVFEEVGGYTGNESLASGDDEFLLQKIAAKYPGKIRYLKTSGAVVQTADQENPAAFYRQRKRWAGKWKHHKSISPALTAVFIFIVNLATPFLLLTGNYEVLLFRLVSEVVFLGLVLRFLGRAGSIAFIPLTQLIYPFYVVFFGLIVQGSGTYAWKGRQLR